MPLWYCSQSQWNLSESQGPLFPSECSFKNRFALLNCNFISRSVAGFPSSLPRRWKTVWEEEKCRVVNRSKSVMWWEFTQNSVCLSFLDSGVVSTSTRRYRSGLDRTPRGVPVMSWCFLPPYNHSFNLYIYFVFFLKHSYSTPCGSGPVKLVHES